MITVIIIIVSLLLLFHLVFNTNSNNFCNKPLIYEFDSGKEGPRILFVAGTHGNEPSGTIASLDLIEKLKRKPISKGKIVVIPAVNLCGLLENNRYNIHSNTANKDINRLYPKVPGSFKSRAETNNIIIPFVLDSDWVIDAHEAHGYYKLNFKERYNIDSPLVNKYGYSMGSTITHGRTRRSRRLTERCIKALNKGIRENYKKFTTFPDSILPGSLRNFANLNNKHYMLIETTGQNDIQPLKVRVDQVKVMYDTVINELIGH